MRRRAIWLIPAIIAALAVTVFLLRPLAWRSQVETGRVRIGWRTTGKPHHVEGGVVDGKDTPLPNVAVDVEDYSGGAVGITDSEGRFSVDLGETEVRALDIRGVGRVEWGTTGLWGLDCQNGIAFRIVVK